MAAQLSIRMSRKQFEEEEQPTGSFDILLNDKKVGSCVLVLDEKDGFALHLAIGALDSEKFLGFSDRQEVHLYGPIAVAFLQLCYRGAERVYRGSAGPGRVAAAFLAIQHTDDEDD